MAYFCDCCGLTAETEDPAAIKDAPKGGLGGRRVGNIWNNHMGDWKDI